MDVHNPEDYAEMNLQKLAEMQQELEEVFLPVLERFLVGIRTRPASIAQAIADNDPERVASESHSLKSVCRQVGFERMGELAFSLEKLGRSGSLEGGAELAQLMIQAGQAAHRALSDYIARLPPA
ncbi:MAG: Hpt domain-containing protein [Magnetococcales bacterium]|nr:Hpt domain-containing protein [Magnetococcales bacterium]